MHIIKIYYSLYLYYNFCKVRKSSKAYVVPDGSSSSSSNCCGVLLNSSVVYDVEVSECCDSEFEKKVCDIEGRTSLETLEISIAFCSTAERKSNF